MPEQSTQYKILIVDDEKKICDLLCSVLKAKYKYFVETAFCMESAISLVSENNYDLVVTDLKLPDGDGIDILRRAKGRDAHTEVIIITAYASLDTATNAINLGASSYLIKPISMENFISQVEKAIANRSFYRKSQMLKDHYQNLSRTFKDHLSNVTSIYELSRKLMFSLNISDIMQIILEDLGMKMESALCVAGISIFGSSEVFAMPRTVEMEENDIKEMLLYYWKEIFGNFEKEKFNQKKTLLKIIKAKSTKPIDPPHDLKPVVVPMLVMGENKGSIAVFLNQDIELSEERYQYLHVFSSLVSPMIENAYIHRRTMNLAATDSLTGVANHRSFHEMLSREIARSNRDKAEFGLIMLDIDDFKQINDTYGHLIGDAVLQDLCAKVLETIREEDLLARYGGEEFMVIVPGSHDKGIISLAERIRTVIDKMPVWVNEIEINYTISIGLSLYNGLTPRNNEALIKDADEALYSSKSHGKNCVSIQ